MIADPAAANSADAAPTAPNDVAQDGHDPASTPTGDCADPLLAPLRGCTDQAARAAGPASADPVWLACQGQCVVTQSAEGARIQDRDGRTLHSLDGLRFLPGGGRTGCMVALPFVDGSGDLIILDAGEFHQRSRHALAPFYAVDFGAEPDLLDRVVESAQLSCDGKRFFAPSLDGVGFAVLDPAGPFPGADAAERDETAVIVISGTGRYGLTVASGGDGHYHLQDFDSGQQHRTNAVFELDMPFFDVEELHLLIRYQDDPGHAEVLALPEARLLGRAALPQDGGLDLRVTGGAETPQPVPVVVPVPAPDSVSGE